MLPYYTELFYSKPSNIFEEDVNQNLDNLCMAAMGCGLEALQAQYKLKTLKQMRPIDREKIYRIALHQRSR